jgi:hypothetical protein
VIKRRPKLIDQLTDENAVALWRRCTGKRLDEQIVGLAVEVIYDSVVVSFEVGLALLGKTLEVLATPFKFGCDVVPAHECPQTTSHNAGQVPI